MPAILEKQNAPEATNYVDFDDYIEFQLRKARSGIHVTDLLTGSIILLACLTGYLLAFAVFDQWIIPGGFSDGWRTSLLVLVAGGALGWTGWRIVYPWGQRINTLYAAREIEQTHPELKSSLLTWVNLKEAGRPISPHILRSLQKRTALQMSHADVEAAVDRSLLMLSSYVLLGLVIAVCLYTLLSPKKMSVTVWRALMPASSVAAATRTEIRSVKPGDAEVLAHDLVDVTTELGGRIPSEVTLFFSTADRRFVDEPVLMRSTGDDVARFQAALIGDGDQGLLKDVSYYVTAGDAKSKTYHIRVIQPPSATVTDVAYDYPPYMGLSNSVQPGGEIEAWEGTQVTVRAKADMPIKRGMLYCSDEEAARPTADEHPLKIDGDRLEASWQLKFREDGSFPKCYFIQVWNDRDQKDPQPTIHRIKIRPDQEPQITLIHPTEDLIAPPNATIPIGLKVRDPDYRLRRVSLKLENQGEPLLFPPPLFEGPPDVPEFQTTYRLELPRLAAKPGDKFSFHVEAEDNLQPFGSRKKNIAATRKVTITVVEPQTPKESEQFNEKQEQELSQKLNDSKRDQEDQSQQSQPGQEQADNLDQPKQNQNQSADEKAGDEENKTEEQQQAEQQKEQPEQKQQEQEQQSNQDSNEAENQQSKGSKSAQSQEGKVAPSQQGNQSSSDSSGKPGEKQKQSGSGQKSSSSDSKGEGSANSKENSGGQKPGDHQQPEGGPPESRKDRAAEDRAMKKVLEWSEKQSADKSEQDSKSQESKQSGEKGEQSQQSGQSGSSKDQQKPADGQSGDKRQPGDNSTEKSSDQPEKTDKGSGDKNSQKKSDAASKDQQAEKNGKGPKPDQSNSNQKSSNSPQDPSDGDQSSQQQSKQSNSSKNPDEQSQSGNDQQGPQGNSAGAQDKPGESKPGQDKDSEKQAGGKSTKDDPQQDSKPDHPNGESGAEQKPSKDANQPKRSPSDKKNESGQNTPPKNENEPLKKDEPGEKSRQNQNAPPPKDNTIETQEENLGTDGESETTANAGKKSSDPIISKESKQDHESAVKDDSSSASSPKDQKAQEQKSNQQGKPGEGQKPGDQSKQGQQQSGSQSGKQSSQGKSGSPKESNGKQSGQDGKCDGGPSSEKPGQKGGSGKQGGKSGNGQAGTQPGEGGKTPAQASGSNGTPIGGGGGTNGSSPSSNPAGGNDMSTPAEEADLSNKKKAANLALKQLKDRMERGDVPKELLDELGYTEEDMKQFMQRLDERLADPGTGQTPESEAARKQFDTLLKGIEYKSQNERREGAGGPRFDRVGGSGSGSRPVPQQYRRQNEAYKQRISRPASPK